MGCRKSGMNSEGDTMKNKKKAWEGVEKMGFAKIKRRRQLAKFPFEKKISILMHLQSIARETSMVSGRKCHEVWKISGY